MGNELPRSALFTHISQPISFPAIPPPTPSLSRCPLRHLQLLLSALLDEDGLAAPPAGAAGIRRRAHGDVLGRGCCVGVFKRTLRRVKCVMHGRCIAHLIRTGYIRTGYKCVLHGMYPSSDKSCTGYISRQL
jgi:hypothetical protein